LTLPPGLAADLPAIRAECALPMRTGVGATAAAAAAAAGGDAGPPFFDVDLVGAVVPRYHMPHFWSDFLPAAEAYGVLLATNRSKLQVTCLGDGPCDGKAPPAHLLAPAVLLPERLRAEAGTSWVKSVLAMLPPKKNGGGGRGPEGLYVTDAFGAGGDGTACFRSLTVPRVRYGGDRLSVAAHQEHVLFSGNGLARSFPPQPGPCTLNVTIVNRPPPAGPAALNRRHIKNAVDLGRRLEAAAATVTLPPGVPSLTITPRVVTFTELPVADQVAAMQAAHMVISLHGAEVTNAVWLRRGAVLAEVMPAFYDADIFPRQADAYGVGLFQVAAKPDAPAHAACLAHFHPPASAGAPAAAALVAAFARRAADAAAAAPGRRRLAAGLNQGAHAELPHMRMCLREQALEVDAVRLAQETLRRGVALCGGSDAAAQARADAYAP